MMSTNAVYFTKMHALGNDFVIINACEQDIDIRKIPIAQLADRHIGIGFDQLLVLESSNKADFSCRIFNADASVAEQCGNGLRCLARYIHESGMRTGSQLSLETQAGIFPISIENYDRIHVTLTAPDIQEKCIQFESKLISQTLPLSIISLGNPHAVAKVDSVDNIAIADLGMEIRALPIFERGANVGFMQVVNQHHIRLRTLERGVGETYACGSNACAAVVAGVLNNWLKDPVNVEFRYGMLSIAWPGKHSSIEMIGPASRVFSGKWFEDF